jgi:hypothetical protein
MTIDLATNRIGDWRSILTLVVFLAVSKCLLIIAIMITADCYRCANFVAAFAAHIHPRFILDSIWGALITLRLVPPRKAEAIEYHVIFVQFMIPINYVTAPLLACFFLLSIFAIGQHEIYAGTVGNDETQISPYDVILVFLSLGYIANSLSASGLVRYLVR